MPYADYDAVTGDVTVTSDWRYKELVKAVPGARWDARAKLWRLPAAWASLVTLRGVLGDELTVGDALTEFAWRLRREFVDPALALRSVLNSTSNAVPVEGLFPFQRSGVDFMRTAGSGLLGDEMGVGKTVQALTLLRVTDQALPALVICPNSVKYHWARLAATWLPEATAYVVDGPAARRRKTLKTALADPAALVILNVESVRLFSRLAPYGSVRLARCRVCDPRHGDEGLTTARCEVHDKELQAFAFRSFICDESHRIKDPKAKQTRAVWSVAHQPTIRYRWALTGTPIANHVADLWSIMHAVAPDDFPTRQKFVDRFALLGWNAFGAQTIVGVRPDTRAELFRLLDPRFRRTLKAQVLPQLPPRVREVRHAELPAGQLRAYRELERCLRTRTTDGELLVAKNHLVAKTRLLQFAAANLTVAKPDPDDVTTWEVELREPSAKLDVLVEVLDELGVTARDYTGSPVLVAAEHKQLLALAGRRLDDLGVPWALLTGDVAPVDRERALDALNAGTIRALLFTSRAGGTGLDMSAAPTLVNLQRSWSLVDERQKEDRNHRIGSERHDRVLVVDVVTRGTVEEDQVTRLHEKFERLEELTRDRAALLAANPAADVAALDAAEARLLAETVEPDLTDEEDARV